jgi:hypothetical protein
VTAILTAHCGAEENILTKGRGSNSNLEKPNYLYISLTDVEVMKSWRKVPKPSGMPDSAWKMKKRL